MTDQDGAASADAEDSAAGEETPAPVPVTVEWTAPDWLKPGDQISFEVRYHLGESMGASDPIPLLPEFDWGDSGIEYHYPDPPEPVADPPEAAATTMAPVDEHPTLLAHPVWRYEEDPERPLRALPADMEFVVDLEVQAPGLEEQADVDLRVFVEGEEAPIAELTAPVHSQIATIEWTLPPTAIGQIMYLEADAADVEDEPVRSARLPLLGVFDFGDTGEPGAPPELWAEPPPLPPTTTPLDEPNDPRTGASWRLAEERDEGLTALQAGETTEVVLMLDARGMPAGAEIPLQVFRVGQDEPIAELVAIAGVNGALVEWTVEPLPVGAQLYFTVEPADPDDPPAKSGLIPVRPSFLFGDPDAETETPPEAWTDPTPRPPIEPPPEGVGPQVHAIRWYDPDTATLITADRGLGEEVEVQIELQLSGYVVGDTISGQVVGDGLAEPVGTFEATVEDDGVLNRARTTWTLPAQAQPVRLVAEVTLGEVTTRSSGLYVRAPFPFGDALGAEIAPEAWPEPDPLPAVTTPLAEPGLHITATSWLDPDGQPQLRAPGDEPFEVVLDIVSDLTLPPTFSGTVIRGSDGAEVAPFEATPVIPGRAAVSLQLEAQAPGEVLYATFEAEGETFRSVPLRVRPPFMFGDGLVSEEPPEPLTATEIEALPDVVDTLVPEIRRVWLLGADGQIQLIAGVGEEAVITVEIDTEQIAEGETLTGQLVSDSTGAEVARFEAEVGELGLAHVEVTVPSQPEKGAVRAVVTYGDSRGVSVALLIRPPFDFGDTPAVVDPPEALSPAEPAAPPPPVEHVLHPTLRHPRWELHGRAALKAPVGSAIDLAVHGEDHPDGTSITFKIVDSSDTELATLTAPLEHGVARAEWPAIAAETPYRFIAEGPDGLMATSALLHPTPALSGA